MTLIRRGDLFQMRQRLVRIRMILEANKRLDEGKDSKNTPPYEVILDSDRKPAIIKVQF